jgi:lysozyme family protein
MAAVKPALEKALKWEGRYSNDPKDAGGETYCGISRRAFPNWSGWPIIEEAKASRQGVAGDNLYHRLRSNILGFYVAYFWAPARCGDLTHQGLADLYFSCAVNMGQRQAVKLLQRAAGAKDDGIVGPKTIAAANAAGETALPAMCKIVEAFYLDQVERRPSDQRFLRCWMNRLADYRNGESKVLA